MNTSNSFLAVFAGMGGGLLSIGFAVALIFIERMVWLGLGAACYGALLFWLSYRLGCAIEVACEAEDWRDENLNDQDVHE